MVDLVTIIFYVSFLCIILMFVSKHMEVKKGTKSAVARVGDKTDHVFQAMYRKVRFVLSHINAHNAIAIIQWIAYHILSYIRKVYISLHKLAHQYPHSKKVIDMVRGKGEVTPNGGSSFYLKRISVDEVKKAEAVK